MPDIGSNTLLFCIQKPPNEEMTVSIAFELPTREIPQTAPRHLKEENGRPGRLRLLESHVHALDSCYDVSAEVFKGWKGDIGSLL